MKRLTVILALLFALPAADVQAASWKGRTVNLGEGTLLCDWFNIEKAMLLREAKDQDSFAVLVSKGKCMVVAEAHKATVTDDASEIKDNDLIEVTVKGESAWTSKYYPSVTCCYRKNESGEWISSLSSEKPMGIAETYVRCQDLKDSLKTMRSKGQSSSETYRAEQEIFIALNCH
jgi:hypothetical protein